MFLEFLAVRFCSSAFLLPSFRTREEGSECPGKAQQVFSTPAPVRGTFGLLLPVFSVCLRLQAIPTSYRVLSIHSRAAVCPWSDMPTSSPWRFALQCLVLAAYMAASHPDFSKLAARIAIDNLHKNTSNNFFEVTEQLHSYVGECPEEDFVNVLDQWPNFPGAARGLSASFGSRFTGPRMYGAVLLGFVPVSTQTSLSRQYACVSAHLSETSAYRSLSVKPSQPSRRCMQSMQATCFW